MVESLPTRRNTSLNVVLKPARPNQHKKLEKSRDQTFHLSLAALLGCDGSQNSYFLFGACCLTHRKRSIFRQPPPTIFVMCRSHCRQQRHLSALILPNKSLFDSTVFQHRNSLDLDNLQQYSNSDPGKCQQWYFPISFLQTHSILLPFRFLLKHGIISYR